MYIYIHTYIGVHVLAILFLCICITMITKSRTRPGLIMFGPIAAAYPAQARAILSLDVSNLAPLVLFGVLCLSFTLGLLKAANSVWGAMSESSYTLVAGRWEIPKKIRSFYVSFINL